jgi:hypothetical protein
MAVDFLGSVIARQRGTGFGDRGNLSPESGRGVPWCGEERQSICPMSNHARLSQQLDGEGCRQTAYEGNPSPRLPKIYGKGNNNLIL